MFAGPDGAPRIVAVIPLAPDVDAHAVARGLAGAVGVEEEDDAPEEGVWKIRYVLYPCLPRIDGLMTT